MEIGGARISGFPDLQHKETKPRNVEGLKKDQDARDEQMEAAATQYFEGLERVKDIRDG